MGSRRNGVRQAFEAVWLVGLLSTISQLPAQETTAAEIEPLGKRGPTDVSLRFGGPDRRARAHAALQGRLSLTR
jgi:hypothetical protein